MRARKIRDMILKKIGNNTVDVERTKPWAGFTKEYIQMFNSMFDDIKGANSKSCCPICWEFVVHPGIETDCMYHKHKCDEVSPHTYHVELYNKYKSGHGDTLQWCKNCGRVTSDHHHYILANHERPPPNFAALLKNNGHPTGFYTNDCTNEGGGNWEEKLIRVNAFILKAKELQGQVGKINSGEAWKILIESAFDAPLLKSRAKAIEIEEKKKFDVDPSDFPPEVHIVEAEAPNIKRPVQYSPPRKKDGTNWVNGEIKEVIVFEHKQHDGTMPEGHLEIGKDSLNDFLSHEILKKNTDKQYNNFGKCFSTIENGAPYDCEALLYPEEIQGYVKEQTYNNYRRLFNADINIIAAAKLNMGYALKGGRRRRTIRKKRKSIRHSRMKR